MELDLAGRSAIVTGGSQGIGRAITLELAAEGVDVMCVARGAENLRETADKGADLPGRVETMAKDCTEKKAAEEVVKATTDAFGRLDILVNNVGYGWIGHDWQTDDPTWEHAMELNLYSAIRFTREAVPHLRKANGRGRILNMSSVSGHSGLPEMGDYNAAKAGMIMWGKTLSRELAPDITVHAICPGFIDTPLWEDLAGQLKGPDTGESVTEVYETMAETNVPLKRYGTSEEVSGLCAFLASDRSAFMTGGIFNIDGGYTSFAFA